MTTANPLRINDAVLVYLSELKSKVVAASGIPSDRHHLGKLILQGLKECPDKISQIDGATGEKETCQSVLERSVKCATAFTSFGLQKGDTVVLMAPNHLDVAIPFYAALYTGIAISSVDRNYTVNELRDTFRTSRPRIIFCQSEKAPDIQLALNKAELDTIIVIFDKGDYLLSFSRFLDKYGDNTSPDNFRATNFDPDETIAVLMSTSGSTGLPKAAAASHTNFISATPYLWSQVTTFPSPTRLALIASPLQWLTAIIHFIASPMMQYPRLQTSEVMTPDHAFHLINAYKPTYTVLSPTLMTNLVKSENRNTCDFTCFYMINLAGSAVPVELVEDLKMITPKTHILNVYGMTEMCGIGLVNDGAPPLSAGKALGCQHYRLVDLGTLEDVTEPYKPGELWVKGPAIFMRYFNNPEATDETFAEGRWFKTGDLFYRDDNFNFYFVERIKLLMKYMGSHISPVEVENVIRQHPGVLDVAVTGIPDPEFGDLAVAFVARRPGHDVTAQQIKDIVKESLSDQKQLRGGVVFVDHLPMTTTTKVHRRKLREMALDIKRE